MHLFIYVFGFPSRLGSVGALDRFELKALTITCSISIVTTAILNV